MFGSINSSGAIIDVIKQQQGEANDILLPNQIERVQKIAVDIGGSLAKVVYLTSGARSQGGRLHFTAFETDNVESCVAFIRTLLDTQQRQTHHAETANNACSVDGDNDSGSVDGENDSDDSDAESSHEPVIMATGGGAHRFGDLLRSELGVEIRVEDEMESLT
ncbi:hypothetical protein IWW50_007163, partial [Coemansia erecta]